MRYIDTDWGGGGRETDWETRQKGEIYTGEGRGGRQTEGTRRCRYREGGGFRQAENSCRQRVRHKINTERGERGKRERDRETEGRKNVDTEK